MEQEQTLLLSPRTSLRQAKETEHITLRIHSSLSQSRLRSPAEKQHSYYGGSMDWV